MNEYEEINAKVYIKGLKDGKEIGKAEERAEWERAAAEMLIKCAGNLGEELPEVVKQVRIDTIDEVIKLMCTDCMKSPCFDSECKTKQTLEQLKEQK